MDKDMIIKKKYYDEKYQEKLDEVNEKCPDEDELLVKMSKELFAHLHGLFFAAYMAVMEEMFEDMHAAYARGEFKDE